MSSKPIVHGVNGSPFVRKVRVALAEKGIDYDLVPLMPMAPSPDYLKMSPLGKIPCYQEGDYTLPDSSCILAYLERKQPQPALYPSDPKEFGRALWYEEYSDTRLTESAGSVFFNRIVTKILKQEPDEEAVAKGLATLPAVFDYLEGELGERDFLVGARFTVADIAVSSVLVNLEHAGVTVDASRWPRLAAHTQRNHARPSFKPLIEEEKAALASL